MAYKICPICASPSPRVAATCSVCGASLTSVRADEVETSQTSVPQAYNHRYGETDLDESSLRWRGASYILVGIILVTGLICAGTVIVAGLQMFQMLTSAGGSQVSSPQPQAENLVTPVTYTPSPTVFLATVTDAPPSRTPTMTPAPTETPGPCMQVVQPGDSLIAIVARCGHRDLDVIALVLQLNNLSAPEVIQSGQTLEIPWPTETPNPEQVVTETPEDQSETSSAGQSIVIGAPLSEPGARPAIAAVPPTATLQPGVIWHQVTAGENIISVAFSYGANVKILSELNPQVTFSQCDFGLPTGGPNCVVSIFEGQLLRVPAPTPTPTLSPTPSGSETPTPTATPTFNAPSALSPGDRRLFMRDEFVTLRWVASGTLGQGQVYRVRVEDVTTGEVFEGDTSELSFVVPSEWQGDDSRRHEYRWTVSVIDRDNPGNPYFTTQPRIFLWEARGASN